MAEFVAPFVQQISAGQNVLFTNEPVKCNNGSISWRDGSGIVTLRGNTSQCRALYKIIYGGNIAIPTSGTVGPISIAISVEGEPLVSSTATVTPAAVGDEFNVFAVAMVSVPRGCCVTVSVKNINTQTIEAQNSNLVIERVC